MRSEIVTVAWGILMTIIMSDLVYGLLLQAPVGSVARAPDGELFRKEQQTLGWHSEESFRLMTSLSMARMGSVLLTDLEVLALSAR